MKRLLVLVTAVAAVAGLTSVALAGDYHVGTTLVCSDCHVMHGSMAHNYPESAFPATPIGPDAPYARLLRNDVNDLCLSCHNGQAWAPDVFGNGTAPPTGGRLAGALNADPAHKANDTGYDVTDGHTLWTTSTAPGGTWANSTDGLECSDCHSVHGSANYRNMRSSTRSTSTWYNKLVTYTIGTPDNTKDVLERSARGYGFGNVDFYEPSQTASAYGAWCKTCHTDFHGSSSDLNMVVTAGGDFKRHPTADADLSSSMLTNWAGKTNRVKLMSSDGTWDGTNTTMTPSCFSCHKSHGNKNGFGLIFMTGTGTLGEEGDDSGTYRDLCRQCHTQGNMPAGNPPLP